LINLSRNKFFETISVLYRKGLPPRIEIQKNDYTIKIEIKQDFNNIFFYPEFYYKRQLFDVEFMNQSIKSQLLFEFTNYVNRFTPYLEKDLKEIIKTFFRIDKEILSSLFKRENNYLLKLEFINIYTIYSCGGKQFSFRTIIKSNGSVNLISNDCRTHIIFLNDLHAKNILLLRYCLDLKRKFISQIVSVSIVILRISIIFFWITGNLFLSPSEFDIFSSLSKFVESGKFYALLLSLINLAIPMILIKIAPTIIRESIRSKLTSLLRFDSS
jgi:hypothetical protein